MGPRAKKEGTISDGPSHQECSYYSGGCEMMHPTQQSGVTCTLFRTLICGAPKQGSVHGAPREIPVTLVCLILTNGR